MGLRSGSLGCCRDRLINALKAAGMELTQQRIISRAVFPELQFLMVFLPPSLDKVPYVRTELLGAR
jgi:hypothetical protein